MKISGQKIFINSPVQVKVNEGANRGHKLVLPWFLKRKALKLPAPVKENEKLSLIKEQDNFFLMNHKGEKCLTH